MRRMEVGDLILFKLDSYNFYIGNKINRERTFPSNSAQLVTGFPSKLTTDCFVDDRSSINQSLLKTVKLQTKRVVWTGLFRDR